MEINPELLKSLGTKQGLKNKEHIEKSWMQDHILYYLSKKYDNFIFKGGTALYKFYSLPRFSEDLDFSTKADVEKEFLKEFAESRHASLTFKKVYDSRLYKLRFPGILTKTDTIRIDINITDSVYTSEIKTYISPYPEIPPFLARVMALEEILAEKIHSLLNRTKARDLYDLFFILRTIAVTKETKELILKKLHDRDINIEEKNLSRELTRRIDLLAMPWTDELKHFVLQELPAFAVVRGFVIKKLEHSLL